MATEQNQILVSIPASADLSASQYCGVYVNSSGQLAVAGEGQAAIGILQDKPAAAGRPGSVCIGGISKVKAGATLAPGARFSMLANGVAGAVGSGDDWSLGVILATGNTTSGLLYSALIQPTGPTI